MIHMLTILRFRRLRVVIFPNDHPPAHVHVIAAMGQATIRLGSATEKSSLIENYGLRVQDLAEAFKAIDSELALLRRKWEEIHGT